MSTQSRTKAGEPSCPHCAAHGIETATFEGDAVEIDHGCTEPLVGVLCDWCEAQRLPESEWRS